MISSSQATSCDCGLSDGSYNSSNSSESNLGDIEDSYQVSDDTSQVTDESHVGDDSSSIESVDQDVSGEDPEVSEESETQETEDVIRTSAVPVPDSDHSDSDSGAFPTKDCTFYQDCDSSTTQPATTTTTTTTTTSTTTTSTTTASTTTITETTTAASSESFNTTIICYTENVTEFEESATDASYSEVSEVPVETTPLFEAVEETTAEPQIDCDCSKPCPTACGCPDEEPEVVPTIPEPEVVPTTPAPETVESDENDECDCTKPCPDHCGCDRIPTDAPVSTTVAEEVTNESDCENQCGKPDCPSSCNCPTNRPSEIDEVVETTSPEIEEVLETTSPPCDCSKADCPKDCNCEPEKPEVPAEPVQTSTDQMETTREYAGPYVGRTVEPGPFEETELPPGPLDMTTAGPDCEEGTEPTQICVDEWSEWSECSCFEETVSRARSRSCVCEDACDGLDLEENEPCQETCPENPEITTPGFIQTEVFFGICKRNIRVFPKKVNFSHKYF